MDPPVLFIQVLGAHRAGSRQLSTENLELQFENLGKVHEAAATLLQRNGMHGAADPDLVPSAIQAKSNADRAFQFDILCVDADGFPRDLRIDPACTFLDFVELQFHDSSLD